MFKTLSGGCNVKHCEIIFGRKKFTFFLTRNSGRSTKSFLGQIMIEVSYLYVVHRVSPEVHRSRSFHTRHMIQPNHSH